MFGNPRLPTRFWAKCELIHGCWIWTAGRQKNGYGKFGANGRCRLAHRVAFEALVGETALPLDHTCRNRARVNPAHLEAVSTATNNRRTARSKLTQLDVDRIRTGHETPTALAAALGVSRSHISYIRSGTLWRAPSTA